MKSPCWRSCRPSWSPHRGPESRKGRRAPLFLPAKVFYSGGPVFSRPIPQNPGFIAQPALWISHLRSHNRKYCQPQRPGDTVWNTANSRYRRIFNDRTGLASARNQRPFLLQTYRRDMGGGRFVVLKEATAPIIVAGRHWGGLRLAFNF